jgi:predicted nucleic acid-binding protein
MIVVDTNVVGYHLLRTAPFAEEVRHLAEQNPDWIAPPLLHNELRNLLTLQHRERGLPLREAKKLAGQAESLFENALFEVTSEAIFDLVAQSTLSAYDCEYVALAQRVNTPLVTYDTDILDDFPATAYEPSDLLDE